MEKRWPGWRVILTSKNDDPAKRVALLLEPTSAFVSWLAQGSSSLQASSLGRSGGGAGKGRRACNYVTLEFEYLHQKTRREMLIGGDDISYDVSNLCTCFSMFVYIRARSCFALIGRHLKAKSTGSHRGIGSGIQIPET